MKFEAIAKHLKGIPYTQVEMGRLLYNHVLKEKPKHCLELGFAHGVATCYVAAALDELGEGHITAVDLKASKNRKPNLEELLEGCNLSQYVTIEREMHSYTWYLKKAIAANTKDLNCKPVFDFCFIDGPKNWTIDGLAFFLVDKLLRKDGWILFDDYRWVYAQMKGEGVAGVAKRDLSKDQLECAQIEQVFKLLVMQHPAYGNFLIDEDWAWAQKTEVPRPKLALQSTKSFKYRLLKKLGKKNFKKA
jgi:predicted O-methyltransferase YrrM